jgi:TolB protein
LYIANPDGTQPEQVTGYEGVNVSPAWSPDGQQLVFQSDRAAADVFVKTQYQIYIYRLMIDSPGLKLLATGPCQVEHPRWSPDSRRVIYQGYHWTAPDVGNWDLYRIGTSGEQVPEPVTDWPSNETEPAWSPDGHWIAFVSGRDDPKGEVYVMDAQRGQASARRLTFSPGADTGPAWSPDGRQLAFASTRTGNGDIYIMEPDTGKIVQQVTSGPEEDLTPAWAP